VDFRVDALIRFAWGALLLAATAGGLAQTAAPAADAGESLAAPSPAASSTPTPTPAAAAPSAEAGRKVYVSSCTRCHGINLAVSSSAFYDLRTFPAGEKERFVRSVTKGLRAMPAWEGTLSAEQIESVWLYIGSVNGWKP
jgi:mono/diheme cytochrome c family protein